VLSTREVVQRIAVRTGYPVKAAWADRTHGVMGTVTGVVRHHTGTGINYARLDDYPTLRVVRQGRPDLPGPLCTWGIGRSGTIYLINAGVAWHAGGGYWRGVSDANGHMWGIEAESDGSYWTAAETDAYHRLVASALYELGRGWEWAPRHAQWALPKGRKTDTGGMDEALFERRVRQMLASPTSINRNNTRPTARPTPAPQPPKPVPVPPPISEGADTMYMLNVQRGTVLVVGTESYVLGATQVAELSKQGVKHYDLTSPGLYGIGTRVLENLRLPDGPAAPVPVPSTPGA
jgi:hypothetical protein